MNAADNASITTPPDTHSVEHPVDTILLLGWPSSTAFHHLLALQVHAAFFGRCPCRVWSNNLSLRWNRFPHSDCGHAYVRSVMLCFRAWRSRSLRRPNDRSVQDGWGQQNRWVLVGETGFVSDILDVKRELGWLETSDPTTSPGCLWLDTVLYRSSLIFLCVLVPLSQGGVGVDWPSIVVLAARVWMELGVSSLLLMLKIWSSLDLADD